MDQLDVFSSSSVQSMLFNNSSRSSLSLSQTRAINGNSEDNTGIRKVCQELESLFIGHLLKEMRATVVKSDLMGGGRAEKIYTSMLDVQLARELSARGGIGIAALLRAGLENRPAE